MTTEAEIDALQRLEEVLREILGGGFEDEVRAQTEAEAWYRQTLPVQELFRLWVRSRVLEGTEAAWVFQGLRMGDRRRLFQMLKLDPGTIASGSATDHAELVLEAVGLPVRRSHGLRTFLEQWKQIAGLVDAGDADRAATLGRQGAERFLRRVLYFYCAAGYAEVFAEMLRDPGSLRVPNAFRNAQASDLAGLLINDDLADLGFLALVLRKFSSRIEESGIVTVSGTPLVLLAQKEYEAFSSLGTALQPYTHDKPSRLAQRQGDFAEATRAISTAVSVMAMRNVIPEGALVLETCISMVGPVFKSVTDAARHVHLVAPTLPRPGQRVLFIASAPCNYATCIWTLNPWQG